MIEETETEDRTETVKIKRLRSCAEFQVWLHSQATRYPITCWGSWVCSQILVTILLMALQLYFIITSNSSSIKALAALGFSLHMACSGSNLLFLLSCCSLWNWRIFNRCRSPLATLILACCIPTRVLWTCICMTVIWAWEQDTASTAMLVLELGEGLLSCLLVIIPCGIWAFWKRAVLCEGKYYDFTISLRINHLITRRPCQFCSREGGARCGKMSFHPECMRQFIKQASITTILRTLGVNMDTGNYMTMCMCNNCDGTLIFPDRHKSRDNYLWFTDRGNLYIVDDALGGKVFCNPSDWVIYIVMANNSHTVYREGPIVNGICTYRRKYSQSLLLATPWTKTARKWEHPQPKQWIMDRWLDCTCEHAKTPSVYVIDMLDEEAGPIIINRNDLQSSFDERFESDRDSDPKPVDPRKLYQYLLQPHSQSHLNHCRCHKRNQKVGSPQ